MSAGSKNGTKTSFPKTLLIFPIASVLAVTFLFLLADRYPDNDVQTDKAPLDKTSWRTADDLSEKTP